MNEILKDKLREKTIKELKTRFQNVDHIDNHYVNIKKFCFMSYDIDFIHSLKCNILGMTVSEDGMIDMQVECK